MRRWIPSFLFTLTIISGGLTAQAAGGPETLVMPLGGFAVQKDWLFYNWNLADSVDGPVESAYVMIAAQPEVATRPPVQFEDERNPFEPPDPMKRLPGTIKIKLGDKELPSWALEPKATAYFINWQAVRANPDYKSGHLTLQMSLESEAPNVVVTMVSFAELARLGSPELNSYVGPLEDAIGKIADAAIRQYVSALAKEFEGDIAGAKAGYASLAASTNVQLARLARRGLRKIEYIERPHKLSGNIMEHNRWGLYLQFAGLFAQAFGEFEEVRIIDSQQADSQFRAGECRERIGGDTLDVIHYFNRAGEASGAPESMTWNVLVVYAKSRGGRTLSEDEIILLKDSFVLLERNLWAASHGVVRLGASFYEIESESAESITKHLGRVVGPPDDLIAERGWYDSVIYIRPRIQGEDNNALEWGGNDVGPNGSAIASFFHDAPFSIYLKALYAHIRAAASTAGASNGWPSPSGAAESGFQPPRFLTSGLRAAMRYHISLADFQRIGGCDEKVDGSFLQLWKVVQMEKSGAAEPKAIVVDGDFVDLKKIYPGSNDSVIRATSWVYVPARQTVGIRLGRNDHAALSVNGRTVIVAPGIAGSKFEGRNLVDTAFTRETLEAGWNEFQVDLASHFSDKNSGFGFSVSVTTTGNELVPGLACINQAPGDKLAPRWNAPKPGEYYEWAKVSSDFHRLLPRIGDPELQTILGTKDVKIRVENGPAPFVAIESASRKAGEGYRAPSGMNDAGDVTLNNILDLSRENVAAFRYGEEKSSRDLLIVRPEALDAVLLLLKEKDADRAALKDKPASQRLLGWVDAGDLGTLFVLDARLADGGPWPADEEDILSPFGPFVPNWPDEFREGPPLPDAPESSLYKLPN